MLSHVLFLCHGKLTYFGFSCLNQLAESDLNVETPTLQCLLYVLKASAWSNLGRIISIHNYAVNDEVRHIAKHSKKNA